MMYRITLYVFVKLNKNHIVYFEVVLAAVFIKIKINNRIVRPYMCLIANSIVWLLRSVYLYYLSKLNLVFELFQVLFIKLSRGNGSEREIN